MASVQVKSEIIETGVIDGRTNYHWRVYSSPAPDRHFELYASGYAGSRKDAERTVRSTRRFAQAGR